MPGKEQNQCDKPYKIHYRVPALPVIKNGLMDMIQWQSGMGAPSQGCERKLCETSGECCITSTEGTRASDRNVHSRFEEQQGWCGCSRRAQERGTENESKEAVIGQILSSSGLVLDSDTDKAWNSCP